MVDVGDLVCHAYDAPFRGGSPGAFGVGHDTVAHFPAQVEAPALFFQLVHHPQALHIMLEPARTELVERPFSGVAKGRVAQVMGQADGLGQVLVQAQGAGNGAGDLRHLQRMGQPGAVQVPFRGQEYLGLLLQAAERLAVQHPVAVTLKHRAQRILRLRHRPAAAGIAEGRPRCKGQVFDLFGSLAHIHAGPLPFLVLLPPFHRKSRRSRSHAPRLRQL